VSRGESLTNLQAFAHLIDDEDDSDHDGDECGVKG
jgi:hypothetical protein